MQPSSKPSRLILLARSGPYLVLAACLAVVFVFVLLGQFAHPSSDDYCMAAGVNRHGLFTYLWNHYFEWSGRYSGNALYAVYPELFGLFDGYRFIAVILIAALLLAASFFLSSLFRCSLFAPPVLLVSLCFVCIYLLGLFSPASSLYWMAGSLTYQTANILLFLILGLMIRLEVRQAQQQGFYVLVAILLFLIVVAMGANETSMLAITAFAFLGLIAHLRSGWVKLMPWLLILVTAIVCFAIVYFSPGNTVRAADFPLRHDLARSIDGSLSVGMKTLWIWLSSPVLIVASVLAPFAVFRLSRLSKVLISVRNRHIALLVVCTSALPFVLQFPAWWAMGGWPPARTLDAIYFLFLLSWFSMIGAITLRFAAKGDSSLEKLPMPVYADFAVLLLAAGFTLTVLTNPSMQRARYDLFHAAEPWHAYMNQRYELVRQATSDGQPSLAVPDYRQEYPRSLYFNDIMHDHQHWRNRCYADYFGLNHVKRDRGERHTNRNQMPGTRHDTGQGSR